MLNENFIGKKKRIEIEDESNDCFNLKNRDELALKFYNLSKKTNNLIEKQSFLKKSYHLNNTRFDIVEDYLNILKKNDIDKYDKEFLCVNKVYNILNKKFTRNDVINFLDELIEIETYEEFKKKLKEKLKIIGEEIDFFNQPFNITYNSNLYYMSFIIKFIYNFLNIKKTLLTRIYKNYDNMFRMKKKIIEQLINFLDIKNGYNFEYILFYITSYFKYEDILNLFEMFLDDKIQFNLEEFKKLLIKKKDETLEYYTKLKKKKKN